jgi:hypothetical protein
VKKLLIGASIVLAAGPAFAGGGATPYDGKPVDPVTLQKLLAQSNTPDVHAFLENVVGNVAKGTLCYLPDNRVSVVGVTLTYEGRTVRCERTLTVSPDDHLVSGRAEWVAVKD